MEVSETLKTGGACHLPPPVQFHKPMLKFITVCLWGMAAAVAHAKPNIVFILSDDQGWADVGWHGSEIQTPNLDKIAEAGAKLEQFYVLPVCSPTRAALLTGRYPMRMGLQTGVVRPYAQYGLPLEERTLPQALREAGYTTAICGKWHLGHHRPEYLPTRRGFDHQYGHYNGAIDYYKLERDGGADWHRDDKVCHDEGYSTALIAKEAVRLIEEQPKDKPLFLYVPFNAPHTPLQVPEEYKAPYAKLPEPRRSYAGMLSAMDEAIGRILAALDETGIRENTLIIFASDNGGEEPGKVANNSPLRGGKYTLYEGGVRVCAAAAWPGQIKPGVTISEPIHMVDWYPTLLKLGGASLDQKLPLDGLDIWPTITAGKPSPHDQILLNAEPKCGAIRVGDWKLIINGAAAGGTKKSGQRVELFNLAEDPNEKRNLAAEQAEKVKALRGRYEALAAQAAPPRNKPMKRGFKVPKIWGELE
jgi:arylsulfatase A-like enzyme